MTDAAVTLEGRFRVEDGAGAHAGIRTIRFVRVEVRNAFDTRSYDLLADLLEAAGSDPDVRVVVLAADGPVFCAGADTREWPDLEAVAIGAAFVRINAALAELPVPLLVAVQGAAVGFGATLLGHADLVVASTDARFRFPFTTIGTVPEAGSSVTLVERLGPQRAFWALMSSEWIDAAEALAIGLVWKLADPAELEATVLAHAATLAGFDPAVVRAGKALLVSGRATAVRDAVAREGEAGRLLGPLADPLRR